MKEIKLLFYRVDPSKENTGLKQVLFEITDDKGKLYHDFGYANWTGKEWEPLDVPEGYSIRVHSWANNPDPKHLIDEARIITMRK